MTLTALCGFVVLHLCLAPEPCQSEELSSLSFPVHHSYTPRDSVDTSITTTSAFLATHSDDDDNSSLVISTALLATRSGDDPNSAETSTAPFVTYTLLSEMSISQPVLVPAVSESASPKPISSSSSSQPVTPAGNQNTGTASSLSFTATPTQPVAASLPADIADSSTASSLSEAVLHHHLSASESITITSPRVSLKPSRGPQVLMSILDLQGLVPTVDVADTQSVPDPSLSTFGQSDLQIISQQVYVIPDMTPAVPHSAGIGTRLGDSITSDSSDMYKHSLESASLKTSGTKLESSQDFFRGSSVSLSTYWGMFFHTLAPIVEPSQSGTPFMSPAGLFPSLDSIRTSVEVAESSSLVVDAPYSRSDVSAITRSSEIDLGEATLTQTISPEYELSGTVLTPGVHTGLTLSSTRHFEVSVTESVTSLTPSLPPTPPTRAVIVTTPSLPSSSSSISPTATEYATPSAALATFSAPATHANVTITSTVFINITRTVLATTTPTEPSIRDVRYLFTLTGDCHLILNNTEFFERFLAGFHDLLTKQLHIKKDKYRLGEITCGTVHVYVTFLQVRMPGFNSAIHAAIHNRLHRLSVPVWLDGVWMTFEVTHAEQVPLGPETDTYSFGPSPSMDEVDIIVIIVACCVCGLLIAIGVTICVKECYRRKFAQSFNLLDIPHVNLKMEDFTLTRIPRPKTIYTEANPANTKAFSEPGQNGESTRGVDIDSSTVNGHNVASKNSINPEDLHVLVKTHSGGIIVGITSSPPCSTISSTHSNSNVRKNKFRIRTSAEEECTEGDIQASEKLLGSGFCGDAGGTLNPVFVDDFEDREEYESMGKEGGV